MAISYGSEPFPTWKLLEVIDYDEYIELDDKDRDYIMMIISAGHIDLRENGKMWNVFKDYFQNSENTWPAILEITKHVYDETTP